MNEIVEQYVAHVDFPAVSGAEHLEMLQLRDEIHALEKTLTIADKRAIAIADLRLIEDAKAFYAELSRFISLEDRRRSQQIPPNRWWWYLDVLAQLPNGLPAQRDVQIAT